jgi:hypothetical protein
LALWIGGYNHLAVSHTKAHLSRGFSLKSGATGLATPLRTSSEAISSRFAPRDWEMDRDCHREPVDEKRKWEDSLKV